MSRDGITPAARVETRHFATPDWVAGAALVVALASLALSTWQHFLYSAEKQETLYLTLEPDSRDYETMWDSGGMGLNVIHLRWVLRVVNLSSRPTAIVAISTRTGYPDDFYVAGISMPDQKSIWLYDGTLVTLPLTLDPGQSIVLAPFIPSFLEASSPEDRIAPGHLEQWRVINDACLYSFDVDVFGNRARTSPGGTAKFIDEFSGLPGSPQSIRLEIQTSRGRSFVVETTVSGHHNYVYYPERLPKPNPSENGD